MQAVKQFLKSFTWVDWLVWSSSVLAVVLAFVLCHSHDYLQLSASLIGACMLILIAKGNVIGQFLSVIFAVFYGIISYFFAYYGELITYLGMTAPMAVASIISWLRHPFEGKKTEVTVNKLRLREYPILIAISIIVSVAFYFILDALNTQNVIWSTVSVLTSCLAVLLSIRRSPHYALAYALNDLVLIVLWVLAATENVEYISMVVCFAMFFLNDLYGLYSWLKMHKRQSQTRAEKTE